MVGCGIDCLNPIQTSSDNMEPRGLKEKYRKKLVFWGGGVDGQTTIPPEVRTTSKKRCAITSASSRRMAASCSRSCTIFSRHTPRKTCSAFSTCLKDYR